MYPNLTVSQCMYESIYLAIRSYRMQRRALLRASLAKESNSKDGNTFDVCVYTYNERGLCGQHDA